MPALSKIALLTILVWSSILFFAYRDLNNENLQVYFLGVGQGDATLIITPEKQKILIDGGPYNNVLSKLGELLPFHDKQIDLLILTHPHADHLDGLVEVLKRYEAKNVLLAPVFYTSATYEEFLGTIRKQAITLVSAEHETDFQFGDNLIIDILFPFEKVDAMEFENLNNASITLKLTYGENVLLFTGDAEKELENILLGTEQELEADYLQAGHHGSKTANGLEFLRKVSPDLVVISAGADNKFGHPHKETLDKLEDLEITYLSTQNGNVSLECDLSSCWQ